ncbi:IAP-2 [Buzura suppressaria nucleopolyhedrovirus]|uniref:IAP-2 n=1 Tax=Buzura suppressaria nuclear polyhedrosis virus TaxID=74320 RepID=W5VKK5_NPVBS|nr:IAP-2 [Buzura suppressaria nucleopolyhedrovirus]AHH82643.1 IAP-2 [Buzura suppressaria nucleopolyhedrovirus]AKN91026.1 IAP-2 [Buzura suppressaria nucleopolyhedrovirus]QYF10617.1 inhibitor of apoptosis 2 [Buzura suppressaria nucleopolyhedrovirus]
MNYESAINRDLAPPFFYKNVLNRFATFNNSINLMDSEKRQFAKHGFYFDRTGYRCAYCATTLSKFNNKSFKYHTFSICKRSVQLLRENESLRRDSFKNFKQARKKFKGVADRLAANGFYYYGARNEIKCCECELVIIKFSQFDTLYIVHKQYSPFCSFTFGTDNLTTHDRSPFAQPSAPPIELITPKSFSEHSDLSNESKIITYKQAESPELNTPNAHESNDVNNLKLYPVLATTNVSHYFERSNALRPANDAKPLSDENKMCVVCFEKERTICFLPCGHVCVCELCADKCKKKCCLCRELIKNKIKVFL